MPVLPTQAHDNIPDDYPIAGRSTSLQSRTKIFLTFAAICVVPLLVISTLGFLGNLKFNQRLIETDLQEELAHTNYDFSSLLRQHQTELEDLSGSSSLRSFIETTDGEPPSDVQDEIGRHCRNREFYRAVATFSQDRRLRVVVKPPLSTGRDVVVQTKDFPPDQFQPDGDVWTTNERQPRCSVVSGSSLGTLLRCTSPIFAGSDQSNLRGALVADIALDALASASAKRSELAFFNAQNPTPTPSALVIVLDDSGTIIYHTNDALKHQQVSRHMPYFAPVANSMMGGEAGAKTFRSSDGDEWLAAYAPLMQGKLSLAVTRNYSLLTKSTRFFGWLSIIAALLVGAAAAVLLSNFFLRKTQSIEQVAEGVGEIAKGKLDHSFNLRSSDALRPIADNVGLVTVQLREQLAREAESRQFESFVRLSAVLTHDLKNTIVALSLIVTNMDKHSDNPEFQEDAMKSLAGATGKLEALVARLSNPVTTLSGEHKRPRPVDLVPMLKRVVSMTAEHLSDQHEIKLDLAQPVFALVDLERMEKVAENLVINAIEAMAKEKGTLTVSAGETVDGKVFFSITDTGEGMSPRFVKERLFRPFATTKRKGVGLGLYTCREVVRANSGAIEVESIVGAGTTFRVVLPSTPIEVAARTEPQNQSHS